MFLWIFFLTIPFFQVFTCFDACLSLFSATVGLVTTRKSFTIIENDYMFSCVM